MNLSPQSILMIKSHSAGVGDLLRSSAAWRVLKNQWPHAKLHLLFLSNHPGYASEGLMGGHHLLDSCTFLTLRERSRGVKGVTKTPFKRLLAQSLELALDKEIDCVIDFEMHGLRSSLLTWSLKRAMRKRLGANGVRTFGVGQFPLRSWFYDHASPGTQAFARKRALTLPMDYTNRDFVALSAMGLERNAVPIELSVDAKAKAVVDDLLQPFHQERRRERDKPLPILGLNIGCGTHDALYKRPQLHTLAQSMVSFLKRHPHDLLLTGAPFEREVNQDFVTLFLKLWRANAPGSKEPCVWDAAGRTDMPELSALMRECQLFVSTDSGPYHMAVALRVPTYCWFVVEQPSSVHQEHWCANGINPSEEDFVAGVERLLSQIQMTPK